MSEKTRIIYIAGPMTGLPEYNFLAFTRAEQALRLKYPAAIIINPAKNFEGCTGLKYNQYIQMNIAQVQAANHIHLLKGHEHSKGAKMEVAIATCLGHEITIEL